MLLVLICLAVVMFLPLMLAMGSIGYRTAQFGKPDIQNPRIQADQLTGAGQRIIAAQYNAWEALALFLTTLMICQLTGLGFSAIVMPAMLFVAARLGHAISYMAGNGAMRFLSFVISIGAIVWMLALAFRAL